MFLFILLGCFWQTASDTPIQTRVLLMATNWKVLLLAVPNTALVLLSGLVLVQKVVDSGEGAGTRANPGHQLHALGGLTQSQHEWRLFGQILRLQNSAVESGADRLSLHGVQLLAHGAVPGV